MMRKYFLAPAILSMALMLVAVEAAQAQFRINIDTGGNRGNQNQNRSGNYGRGYYDYGRGQYYDRGYYDSRGYYQPYRSQYYTPYWTDYIPQRSYYYSPATEYVEPATNDVAHIRVLLPDPNARIWFNGSLTAQTGAERMFHTPPLSYGLSHMYAIRASWMQGGREVIQERNVSVTPGGTFVVDFTR